MPTNVGRPMHHPELWPQNLYAVTAESSLFSRSYFIDSIWSITKLVDKYIEINILIKKISKLGFKRV